MTRTSKYLHLTTFSNIFVILSTCTWFGKCVKMPKLYQNNEFFDYFFGEANKQAC